MAVSLYGMTKARLSSSLSWDGVLMSVRRHTPDGPVEAAQPIHGMVCADRFGTRVVEFDGEFRRLSLPWHDAGEHAG